MKWWAKICVRDWSCNAGAWERNLEIEIFECSRVSGLWGFARSGKCKDRFKRIGNLQRSLVILLRVVFANFSKIILILVWRVRRNILASCIRAGPPTYMLRNLISWSTIPWKRYSTSGMGIGNASASFDANFKCIVTCLAERVSTEHPYV